VILLLGLPALLSMWLRAPTQVPAYGDAGSAASTRQSAASISGTVVTLAKKPEPIAGATVVVRRIDPARQSAPDDIDGGSTTDQQGRFVISGLTAGTYELRAAKPGYVPTEYDATRPGEVGRGVVLASGQSLAGLTVTLPRAGVISGTVVDGAGVPVARLPVAARRASSPTSTVRTVLTDHLGAYRLHGLPPGEYLVVASPADRAAVPVEAPSGGGIGDYAPVFYPGTINADQAARVKVDAGIETDAIDLMMVRSGTTQIAGVVFDVDGQPAVGALVSLSSAGGVQSVARGSSGSDGSFRILNVAPGQYTLTARLTRVTEARPDTSGHFTIRALPAGEYLIAVLEHLDPDDLDRPNLLDAIAGTALKVRLREGEVTAQSLRLPRIP